MRDLVYLAWRYLTFYRLRSSVLVVSIALVLFVPCALQVIVSQGELRLRSRADSTPLIIGAKGSALELALNSLYYDSAPPETISVSTVGRVASREGITAIPLYCRFAARGYRVVGTSADYFRVRNLRIASGEGSDELGECVAGATVARELQLQPGDTILTSGESAFDLAGVYPTMLRVVGVLQPSESPDDRALFTSLETTWIIEGLGHGHDEFKTASHDDESLAKDKQAAAAHAALVTYREVTEQNVDSFHFHGDRSQFPITAVLAFASDKRSIILLEGDLRNTEGNLQVIVPSEVITGLLSTVLTVRSLILLGTVIVGLSTVLTVALVYWLALRLRQRELRTFRRIGCSRSTIPLMVAFELLTILLMSVLLAALLTWLTSMLSDEAYRLLIRLSS